MRLGVNIDHVATLRNARTDKVLDLIKAVKVLKKKSVDSVTVHLREDRRHIKDEDVKILKKHDILPMNLEMAATFEMQKICIDTMPFACCIVPERREELTTEGGLNVKNQIRHLEKRVLQLQYSGMKIIQIPIYENRRLKLKELNLDSQLNMNQSIVAMH